MNLFRQLTSKPWLVTEPAISENHGAIEQQAGTTKTALMFFLMVVTVLFFLITITFLSRSQYPDFVALAGESWLPFTKPVSLWVNSALLLVACVLMHVAKHENYDNRTITLLALSGAALFSGLFLIGQVMVWLALTKSGFAINDNPANSYFYLFTGIHALHLLGGFIALGRGVRAFVKRAEITKLKASLRLCTIYWHYLFVVWMLLFALLTATPETYKTIALLCGF